MPISAARAATPSAPPSCRAVWLRPTAAAKRSRLHRERGGGRDAGRDRAHADADQHADREPEGRGSWASRGARARRVAPGDGEDHRAAASPRPAGVRRAAAMRHGGRDDRARRHREPGLERRVAPDRRPGTGRRSASTGTAPRRRAARRRWRWRTGASARGRVSSAGVAWVSERRSAAAVASAAPISAASVRGSVQPQSEPCAIPSAAAPTPRPSSTVPTASGSRPPAPPAGRKRAP